MPSAPQSPESLIATHQALVRSLATKIHRRAPSYVDLEDLVSYGQIGLAEAARDFDAGRGGQFSTYAYYRIRGAIYDGLSKMSWTSRSRYNRLRYQQMANESLRMSQEAASVSSGNTGHDQARWLGDITDQLVVVYLATKSDEQEGGVRESSLADDLPSPSVLVAGREMREKLHECIDQLSPESQTLVRATYFEGLTLQDAGKRLGLSKSWASRLHARALRQLASLLRGAGIEDDTVGPG